MLLYGDEIIRSQKGNNNAYCQDNELTWFNWDDTIRHADILEFCKKAVALRKKYAMMRCRRFFSGKDGNGDSIPDIRWFDRHLNTPDWNNGKVKTLCYQLAGNESLASPGDYYLYFIYTMLNHGSMVDLPVHNNIRWFRIVDTVRKAGDDFLDVKKGKLLRNQAKHYCGAYSVSVFLGER
jgi:glycogen operon protein